MQHLLLLHGAIGSSAQLTALQQQLQGSFHTYLFDFPGHGKAPMPQEFSIPYFAGSLLAFMQEYDLARVHIFGYSMGGYVAMWLAKHHSECVNKILTLGTKFYWDEDTAAKEVKMLQPEVIEQKIPAFAQTLSERHNDWKTVLAKTADMLRGMGNHNPLQNEDYISIIQPSLIMIGDHDKMVTREETEVVAAALPNGSLYVLPATPHPLEQVDTMVLAGLITGFLNKADDAN